MGYEEFVQRQVNARLAREEMSRVPHITGEGWTGKGTKVKGFQFSHRDRDRDELRSQIKSLKKPTSAAGGEEDEYPGSHDKSESPGGISSPGDEGGRSGDHIPLHEIVAMQWYYV